MFSSVDNFPLGKTWYDGATIDSNNLGGVDQEGFVKTFQDLNPSSPQGGTRTPFFKICRLMRNISGIAALPKRSVSNQAGANWGKRFDGYTDITDDGLFAGVVDEHLPSAGCPVNDMCWVTVWGPTLVLTDLAASESNVISIGDPLATLTAATSEATTAGRIGRMLATGATRPLALAAANKIGRALSAKTTDNTNADLLVHLERYPM